MDQGEIQMDLVKDAEEEEALWILLIQTLGEKDLLTLTACMDFFLMEVYLMAQRLSLS